jgi:hypothetical protein
MDNTGKDTIGAKLTVAICFSKDVVQLQLRCFEWHAFEQGHSIGQFENQKEKNIDIQKSN